MNYIKQLNAFYDFLQANYITSSSQLVYRILLDINNSCNWVKTFQRTNQSIMALTQISEKTLISAKNELKQLGLIDYTKGVKNKPSSYKIHCLYSSESGSNGEVMGKLSGSNGGGNGEVMSADIINKTKLNQTKQNTPQSPHGGEDCNSHQKSKEKDVVQECIDKHKQKYKACPELIQAIDDFVEFKKKKQSLWKTTRGTNLWFKSLEQHGDGKPMVMVKVIERSLANGWQGIFSRDDDNKPVQSNALPRKQLDGLQYDQRDPNENAQRIIDAGADDIERELLRCEKA